MAFAGNMQYTIYRWLVPAVEKMQAKAGVSSYWFPDATRFIGYFPETNDKTIHEFPSYSFILGDLHAHVINLLFTLTVLGILLGWLYSRESKKENDKSMLAEIFQPAHILIGFFRGIFQATNFWDFPIYFIVAGAIILFSNAIVYKFKGKAVAITLLQGTFILVLSLVFILPFTINLIQCQRGFYLYIIVQQTGNFGYCGTPVAIVIMFLLSMISDFVKGQREEVSIFSFMEYLHPSSLYIITIGLCAIGLVLIPELVYVKDIYSGDYKRPTLCLNLHTKHL